MVPVFTQQGSFLIQPEAASSMLTTSRRSKGVIMKKRIVPLVIIAIVMCLTPQTFAEKSSSPGNQSVPHYQEIIDGEWNAPENPGITDSLAEIFEKATADIEDYEYNPVALIESKTVAGYCYRFLCEARDINTDIKPRFAIVEVFKDLDGNAKVISINEQEPHSISEVTAFTNEDSAASEEFTSIENTPVDGTMQTIQGNAGESMMATVIVTFVKE